MAVHKSITPEEVADRLAIRELIDRYAHCADTRDASGQLALFAVDAHFAVYMDATSDAPTSEFHRRDDLAVVFDQLNSYRATAHFNGQSTIVLQGKHPSGVTYCLAHHVSVVGDKRSLMVASIRYLDRFVKQDDAWLFAERKLMVEWIETRSM